MLEYGFRGGKLVRCCKIPKLCGLYALIYYGELPFPALEMAGGWMVRVGSSKNLYNRVSVAARTIHWDGMSSIKGAIDHHGLTYFLKSLSVRPGPEKFSVSYAIGENHQFAERLAYRIAGNLTGYYPVANRCKPGLGGMTSDQWLAGRAEGGVKLASELLGETFYQWAARGKAN